MADGHLGKIGRNVTKIVVKVCTINIKNIEIGRKRDINKIFIIGTQIRKRFCGNPKPIPPGKNCRGNDEQTRKCLLKKCPGKNNIVQLAKFNVVLLENLGTNLAIIL